MKKIKPFFLLGFAAGVAASCLLKKMGMNKSTPTVTEESDLEEMNILETAIENSSTEVLEALDKIKTSMGGNLTAKVKKSIKAKLNQLQSMLA